MASAILHCAAAANACPDCGCAPSTRWSRKRLNAQRGKDANRGADYAYSGASDAAYFHLVGC